MNRNGKDENVKKIVLSLLILLLLTFVGTWADLGPSLKAATAFGPAGLTKIPFDVFELKGCQE